MEMVNGGENGEKVWQIFHHGNWLQHDGHFYGCRHSCLTDWQSNENKCDVPRTWINIYFNGPKLVHAFSVRFFFSVHFKSFEKQKRITCSLFGK